MNILQALKREEEGKSIEKITIEKLPTFTRLYETYFGNSVNP